MQVKAGTPGFILPVLTDQHVALINQSIANDAPFYEIEQSLKSEYLTKRFKAVLISSAKVYVPVHFLLMLLKLRNRKYSKISTLKRFVEHSIRSIAFGTGYGICVPSAVTYMSWIFKSSHSEWLTTLFAGMFACSIFFESPERWGEISLYALAQWFHACGISLVKQRRLPNFPNAEKYLLAVSMALASYLFYNKSEEGQDGNSKPKKEKLEFILEFLLGDKNLKS
jgi:hypothetical protein